MSGFRCQGARAIALRAAEVHFSLVTFPAEPCTLNACLSIAPLHASNRSLQGKRALVAGVADDGGYGFAIAKALAEAGATVSVATWPPALNIFLNLLERGKMDESRKLSNGKLLEFEKIYPLDAAFTTLDEAPPEIRENKRYKDNGDFSIEGMTARLLADFGAKPLDIVIHSLANGPEVKKPLLETSRSGYLTALSVSAYSLVAMVNRLGAADAAGRIVLLAHLHGEREGDPGLRRRNVARRRPRSRATRECSPTRRGARTDCA